MLSTISFIVSALLIASLFSLRYVEIGRGARFAPRIRKSLDVVAVRTVAFLIHDIPRILARVFKYLLIHITDFFSSILLQAVRSIEERLHVLVHRVRGKKNDLNNDNAVSDHLTDMKNHKEAVSKTIEELEKVE